MHSANMELYHKNSKHMDFLITCISIVVRSTRFCKVTFIKINTFIPCCQLHISHDTEMRRKNQDGHIVFFLTFVSVMMYHKVHSPNNSHVNYLQGYFNYLTCMKSKRINKAPCSLNALSTPVAKGHTSY